MSWESNVALKKIPVDTVKPVVEINNAYVDTFLGKGLEFLWGYSVKDPDNILHTTFIVSIDGDTVTTKRAIYKVLSWKETTKATSVAEVTKENTVQGTKRI